MYQGGRVPLRTDARTPDGVVVISGDPAYNPALADFAKGADILANPAVRFVQDRCPVIEWRRLGLPGRIGGAA